MTEIKKKEIVNAMEAWLKDYGFSANEFSEKTGVPANYLSLMRNGRFEVPTGNGKTPIADRYFNVIAAEIGLAPDGVKWTVRQTPQLMQMLSYLEEAKKFGYTTIIIGETGSGKTFATDLFVKESPRDCFKITVGSLDTIGDLLDKICAAMRINATGSKSKRIGHIIRELIRMKMEGRNPALIWDESEFMKQTTLCNIKEMHDHLYGKCALIMIGTNQLIEKIERLKNKNRPGMPQFYRRVKYGIRELRTIDTRFKEFLTTIPDLGLVKFLQNNCDNYGNLHDVLLPAMREAERLGEPLSEDLVRKVLNLPKL